MQFELTKHGVALTQNQVESLLNIPTERRKAAITYLQQHGLAYIYQQIVQRLNNQSYAFESRSMAVQNTSAPLRLIQASADCQAFRQIIDTLEIIGGLNGLGCLAGCLPCCGIVVGIVIVVAVLELGFDLVCS